MTTQPAAAAQPQVLVVRTEKSMGIAYALNLFLGTLGLHRFYVNRTGSGIAMAVLSCTLVGLIITGPWAIIDLFLTAGMVRAANAGAGLPVR